METISKRTKHSGFVLFLAVLMLLCVLSGGSRATAQDVLTWHNDNARTGQNLEDRTLTIHNVNPKTFGKLFTISVDGKVDAEPLYTARSEIPNEEFRNVLFVATEHDSLYAFDADTQENNSGTSGYSNREKLPPTIFIAAKLFRKSA
jgi:hypothetical protein